MHSFTTQPSSRAAAAGAAAASAALGVSGVLQLTHHQSGQSTTVGIEHVILGGFTALLVALVPAVLFLGRIAGRPRAAACSVTGQLLLAALTVVSNVRGEDPSFFAAVAVPANLLWLGGMAGVAVGLARGGRVPRVLAIALPLSWFAMLPLGPVGGSLVAGAFWLALAWLIANGELPRAAPRAAAAQAA
jgi:hypothetical protein